MHRFLEIFMKIALLARLLVAAGLSLTAIPLCAAAGDLIKARVESYREIGASMKNINDELRSGAPQPIILQLSARQILSASRAQYAWYPAGSGPGIGVKTKAKAQIWSNAPQFKASQDAFAREALAFSRVARTGDVARLRAAARTLGQTCAACHRQFRSE